MKSKTKTDSATFDDSKQCNRRQFLRSSAVAPLGLLTSLAYTKQVDMKITRINLFCVLYPTKGYFKFFTGPRGTYGRGAVIVKILTDSGAAGWGQS
ncbi:MAG: hypothetical protein JSW66_03185, partial [Phycisphaerales bacterium]